MDSDAFPGLNKAMLTPVGVAALRRSGPHTVKFYESDESLAPIIADFIADGIAAREASVVILTAAHRSQVTAHLAQRGILLDDALTSGGIVFLDADDTLARLMDGGSPSWERFHATINGVFDAVTRGAPGAPIRAFAEMVDVLWRAGRIEAAVQLEEMWNALQRERPFSLLRALSQSTGASVLLPEVRRNQRLQQVTASIAAAVTREEVLEAIVDKVATTLGASRLVLFLYDEETRTAKLARHVGITPAQAEAFEVVPLDGPSAPALEPLKTGVPLFLSGQAEVIERYPHLAGVLSPGSRYRMASLPLVVHGTVIGSMGLTFDDAPPLDLDERDLLQVIAGYSAIALERVRLSDAERTSRERAELLYGLAGSVLVAQSVEEVFEAALDAIAVGLHTMRSSILTYGQDPVMHFRAWRGLSDRYRTAVDGHSPWARDTRDARPIAVTDVETDPAMAPYRPIFGDENIRAVTFIPLIAGQQLLGKFMLYYDQPRPMRPAEIDLARAIADHVAAALTRFAAVAELEETVRFNEVFTGILGHDLRNPLGAIVTAAQLAMMKNPSEKLHKPLSRILTSSTRMSRMIDQLLDFTHVRLGGGMPLSRQRLDLVPIVRHVVDELDDAHPEWTLTLDHAGDTFGSWDGDRLAQVFSNLVANALQHGDVAGGVQVRLDGSRRDVLRAEIENAGTIPADVAGVLFEPLAGGRSRRPGARGLGLGLFISREIVRAHGGAIEVRTAEGTRTIFEIELPRAH